jgi:hypothetical protein
MSTEYVVGMKRMWMRRVEDKSRSTRQKAWNLRRLCITKYSGVSRPGPQQEILFLTSTAMLGPSRMPENIPFCPLNHSSLPQVAGLSHLSSVLGAVPFSGTWLTKPNWIGSEDMFLKIALSKSQAFPFEFRWHWQSPPVPPYLMRAE